MQTAPTCSTAWRFIFEHALKLQILTLKKVQINFGREKHTVSWNE